MDSRKIIVKNAVVREKGYLYYVDGNGSVCRCPMQHKGKSKKKKLGRKKKN